MSILFLCTVPAFAELMRCDAGGPAERAGEALGGVKAAVDGNVFNGQVGFFQIQRFAPFVVGLA